MPVTADLQYYATYSPAQESSRSSNANSSYPQSPSPNARRDNHASREALDSSIASPPPRRRPSLFRRINAAIKTKSSSSESSDRRDPPLTDSMARKSHADPMYTAHPSVHPSRQSSLSMNPVSRFRRARNAEKAVREQSFPPEEWHVNEGTQHDQASVSRSRSDVRGYSAGHSREDIRRKLEEPPKPTRVGSERHGNGSRSGGTPPSYRQTSEPIPHNKSAVMRPSRSPVSHNTSGAEHVGQHQYVHAKRPVPGRSHTQPSRPVYSSESPSRMGKYEIYASPTPSSSRTSSTPHTLQENPIPRHVSEANERRYKPTTNHVEGWDVTIASPRTSTQSSSGSGSRPYNHTRRPTQTRAYTSRSGGLTLVSDHPLVDRPLPSPPEKMEAKEAEEFARSLTQRMSVLLEMDDVDFTSSQALCSLPEESGAHCPSVSSSGTATPTGPLASEQSIQPIDAGADTPLENAASQSSPFGTFFTNAREMNNAFVRGTGSIWNNLFGKNKGKENEKEKMEEPGETHSGPVTSSGSQTEGVHKVPGHDSGESDIEGSRDIMLYSPLIPDADSIVEVATSEVVTLYSDNMEDAREHAYRAELRRRWADGRGFISFDALSTIEPVQEESAEPEITRTPREQADPSEGLSSLQGVDENPRTKPRERVVWVPSPDKISVQVLWWGYRIYLPPPVLHVLNGRTDETAKRAALLTAALTWLLNNLPLASLPPVLAPAALLLRALVPLLGMIGSFIAWSWRATMSFDKGNGVVLSATWVLPIVLVPGTWDNEEVPPGPIVPPSSTEVE